MTLGTKLTALFLILTIAPMLLVSLLVYRSGRESIERNMRSRLMTVALLKEAEFRRWLSGNESMFVSLAQRPQVRDLALDLVTQPPTNPAFQQTRASLLDNHLVFFTDHFEEFSGLFILHAATSEVLVSTDPTLEGTRQFTAPFFREGRTQTFIGHAAFDSHTGGVEMHISTPITDQDGNLLAVLVGHIDLANMTTIMQQDIGEFDTQETYLIDRNHLFVTESRLSPNLQLRELNYSQGINQCLKGENGTGFYDDYRGVVVIGAYRWIPERSLCIVTEVDRSEALAPVFDLRSRVIVIGLGTAIAAAVLGVLVARTVSGKVTRLARGAEAIGQGDLDYRVDVTSRDEIGTLGRAFNEMAAALRISQAGLRQQRDFVDTVLDTSSALTIVLDREGRIVRFNRHAEAITGQTFAEVKGRPLWELAPLRDEAEAVRAAFADLCGGCFPAAYESHWTMPNGSETIISWQNTGVVSPDGEIEYVIWTGIDVTERESAKRALQALNQTLEQRILERTRELEESEQRFRQAIMSAPLPIMLHTEGEVLLINNMWTAITGYTHEDIPTTRAWTELAYGPRQEWARRLTQTLYMDDGGVIDVETPVRTRSGDVHLWRFRAAPLGRLPDGRALALSMAMDLTERETTEQALRESQRQIATLLDNLPGIAYRCRNDALWTMEFVSQGCRPLTGYDPDDLVMNQRIAYADLIDPADRQFVSDAIQAALAAGTPFEIVYRIRTASGQQKVVWEKGQGVRNESGEIDAIEGFINDITERHEAERAVRESEAKFRAVIEQAADGILLIERDGTIAEWNKALERITGVPRADAVGRPVWEISAGLWPAESPDEIRHMVNGYLQTVDQHWLHPPQDNAIYRADGERRFVQTEMFIMGDGDDRMAGAVIHDVTERRRAAEAIESSRRFLQQTIDTLTAHIAILDENGTIVAVNEAWKRFADENDLNDPAYGVGTSYLSVCDAASGSRSEHAPEVAAGIRRILAGDSADFYVEYPCPSEQVARWFSLRLNPFESENGLRIVAAHYDITERVEAEMAEHEQRLLAESLHEATATLTSTLDLDTVLEKILALVGRVVNHDAAKIMLIEGGKAYFAHWHGHPPHFEDYFRTQSLDLETTANLRIMIETQEPLLIPDTSAFEGWRIIAGENWVRSQAAAPILAHGEVIGFITLDSKTPGFFTPAHLERLKSFADQTAVAAENAQLYAEVRRQAADLEKRVIERTIDLSIRNAVAEILTHSLDAREILTGVIHEMVERLGVLGGVITYEGTRADAPLLSAHFGLPRDVLAMVQQLVPGGPQPGAGKKVRCTSGIQGLPERIHDAQIRAVLSAPIFEQDRPVGTIVLVNSEADFISQGRMKLLDTIGKQVSIALSNARLYEQALYDEARTRTILDSVADGLLMLDPDGHLVMMNPAAQALFGFYPAELGGPPRAVQHLWKWIEPQAGPGSTQLEFPLPTHSFTLAELRGYARNCPLAACGTCGADERDWAWWLGADPESGDAYEVCPVYRQTPSRVIQANIAPVTNPDGDMLGTVIALRDVTHYREIEQLKDSFVSAVSHELRTPLAAVMLNIGTLQNYYDRFSDEARRQKIDNLHHQATVLRNLVEDILELSRLEAKRTAPRKEWFDLPHHCGELLDAMQPLILEKELDVRFEADSAFRVFGDLDQLGRVFRNIVGNAVKYTPNGGTVRVRVEQHEGEARLVVTDSGIGIAPEEQPYVFDRFFRSERASDIASGTGLGLAITKEIVDLHDGRIELDSVLGQGSTFTVSLPIPPSTPETVEPIETSGQQEQHS